MFGDELGYNPSRKTKQLGEIVSREAANKSGETNVKPSFQRKPYSQRRIGSSENPAKNDYKCNSEESRKEGQETTVGHDSIKTVAYRRASNRAEQGHNAQKNRYQIPDRYLLFEVLYSLRIDHAIPGAVQNAALGTSTAR